MQEEVERSGFVDRVAMRVGINTGPAHLGTVGASAEYTAMGDTVNVASRVQSAAPLGGVLVTHDTYLHVRGVFDVEELEPADCEGQGGAHPRVRRAAAKPRAFRMRTRREEGVETRMVGRGAELDLLKAEFELVVDQPQRGW